MLIARHAGPPRATAGATGHLAKVLHATMAVALSLTACCNLCLAAATSHALSDQSEIQAIDQEVTTVLASLSTKVVTSESSINIESPVSEVQDDVSRKLSEIATRSAAARARVIYWLIQTVEDQAARKEGLIATKWVTAVRLLGTLKA